MAVPNTLGVGLLEQDLRKCAGPEIRGQVMDVVCLHHPLKRGQLEILRETTPSPL